MYRSNTSINIRHLTTSSENIRFQGLQQQQVFSASVGILLKLLTLRYSNQVLHFHPFFSPPLICTPAILSLSSYISLTISILSPRIFIIRDCSLKTNTYKKPGSSLSQKEF
ncbi:hypothetical protein DFP73DRAFT_546255 [Morchella snyderi]|nr:hypothetical protein DFP73DRAFT_546255 [Morchella snyderi]